MGFTRRKGGRITPCRCSVHIHRLPITSHHTSLAANMHTSTLLTTLFAALTTAQLNYCTGNKQTLGHCDTLSYTDVTLTTANAPNSTDCNDTCRTMFWDAGDWLVDLKGRIPFSPSFPSSMILPTFSHHMADASQANQKTTCNT
jgi:hypothetical protein